MTISFFFSTFLISSSCNHHNMEWNIDCATNISRLTCRVNEYDNDDDVVGGNMGLREFTIVYEFIWRKRNEVVKFKLNEGWRALLRHSIQKCCWLCWWNGRRGKKTEIVYQVSLEISDISIRTSEKREWNWVVHMTVLFIRILKAFVVIIIIISYSFRYAKRVCNNKAQSVSVDL